VDGQQKPGIINRPQETASSIATRPGTAAGGKNSAGERRN